MVEDILSVFKPEGSDLVPTCLVTMGTMGWNLLPFLDEEETTVEERDSVRLIKSKEVTAEKAYMAYFTGAGSWRGRAKGKGRKSSLNGVSAGGLGNLSNLGMGAVTDAQG